MSVEEFSSWPRRAYAFTDGRVGHRIRGLLAALGTDHGDPRLPSQTAVDLDPLLAPVRAARLIDLDVDARPAPEFAWPCDRRDAHHPHPRELIEVRDLSDAEPRFVPGESCPGVPAHPATMIGRRS